MPYLRSRPTIHAAQSIPTLLDCQAALERACELIVDASKAGADWILFSEAFIPGYPAWTWSFGLGAGDPLGELLTDLLAEAVAIPSNITDRLCRVAQRSHINVAIGLIERAEAALYSTLLVIDARGRILGRYRRRLPSSLENAIWLPGGEDTPAAHESRNAAGQSDIRGI
jgi:nitrilase